MTLTPNFCPLDFIDLPATTAEKFQTYLVKATRQDIRDDEHAEYYFLNAPEEHRIAFFLAYMLKSHVSKEVLTLENLSTDSYKNVPELEDVMSEFCVIDGIGLDTLFDFRVKRISESDGLKLVKYIEVNPLNTDFVPDLYMEAL